MSLIEDRLFEYLAATKDHCTTDVPGPRSFTSALIYALTTLRQEKAEGRFTTDELLRKIKTDAPDFPKDQTPVMSPRDKKNASAGRIMLHPLHHHHKGNQSSDETSKITGASRHMVTLHFDFGEKPSNEHLETIGQKLNEIFELNTLGVHRVRWGGMRETPFGRAIRSFTLMRERRASENGSRSSAIDRISHESLCSMDGLDTSRLSPRIAVFDDPDSIGGETPSPYTASSPATSNTEDGLEISFRESLDLQKSRDDQGIRLKENMSAKLTIQRPPGER